MNYIKHLTGFFNKSNQDAVITPMHICLYLALFQRWNLNRFKNPIIISREEMMITAKIKSKATYHKCMKDLHRRKYLVYKPSYNPYSGTEVILPDLSNIGIESVNETSSSFEQSQPKNVQVKAETRLKNERTELKNGQDDEQVYIYNKTYKNSNKTIDMSTPIKEKKMTSSLNSNVPPALELVKAYFNEKNISELEAEKYFNYYSSNGWKVGGRTQMKDWRAAARNWILNLGKFNQSGQLQPNNLNVSNSKDYAEPL